MGKVRRLYTLSCLFLQGKRSSGFPLTVHDRSGKMTDLMAYLRIQRKGKHAYYMIQKSERRGGKVVQKILEFLGRNPEPKRLKRAMEYWGVKSNHERPKGR